MEWMIHTRVTLRARQRMKLVLARIEEGKTLREIATELKVTRERVRQIENLGRHFFGKAMKCRHPRPKGWKESPTPTFRCGRCWKVVKVPAGAIRKLTEAPKKKSIMSAYFYWGIRKDKKT